MPDISIDPTADSLNSQLDTDSPTISNKPFTFLQQIDRQEINYVQFADWRVMPR